MSHRDVHDPRIMSPGEKHLRGTERHLDRIRDLEAERDEWKSLANDRRENVEGWRDLVNKHKQRAEAAEAKLAKIEGLPRYEIDSSEVLLDGAGEWIKAADVRGVLQREHCG